MVCDCCLKRKKLFESFAAIQTDSGIMNLCVDCNDLAYKIRDDANDGDKEKYDEHLKELEKRGKKPNAIYIEWKKKYLATLDKKLPKEPALSDEAKNLSEENKKSAKPNESRTILTD